MEQTDKTNEAEDFDINVKPQYTDSYKLQVSKPGYIQGLQAELSQLREENKTLRESNAESVELVRRLEILIRKMDAKLLKVYEPYKGTLLKEVFEEHLTRANDYLTKHSKS